MIVLCHKITNENNTLCLLSVKFICETVKYLVKFTKRIIVNIISILCIF